METSLKSAASETVKIRQKYPPPQKKKEKEECLRQISPEQRSDHQIY